MKREFAKPTHHPVEDSHCSAHPSSEPEGEMQGQSAAVDCNRWPRTSAAAMGLALSVGVFHLFLPRQADQAMAVEPLLLSPPVTATTAPSKDLISAVGFSSTRTTLLANPQQAPATRSSLKHVVKKGQTLWQIAQIHQVSAPAIATANRLDASATLLVGQILEIPAAGSSKPALGRTGLSNVSPTRRDVRAVEPSPTRSVHTTAESRKDNTISYSAGLQNTLAPVPNVVSRKRELLIATQSRQMSFAQSDPSAFPKSLNDLDLSDLEWSRPLDWPEQSPGSKSSVTSQAVASVEETEQLQTPDALPGKSTGYQTNSESSLPAFAGADEASPLPRSPRQSPQILAPLPVKPLSEINSFQSNSAVEDQIRAVTEASSTIALNTSPDLFPGLQIPVIPSTSSETVRSTVHRVRSGETLSAIALHYGVSHASLIQANQLQNPNLIQVDQRLVIPQSEAASVAAPAEPLPSTPIAVASASSLKDQETAEASIVALAGSDMPLPILPNISADQSNVKGGEQPETSLLLDGTLLKNFDDSNANALSHLSAQPQTGPYIDQLMVEIRELQQQYPLQADQALGDGKEKINADIAIQQELSSDRYSDRAPAEPIAFNSALSDEDTVSTETVESIPSQPRDDHRPDRHVERLLSEIEGLRQKKRAQQAASPVRPLLTAATINSQSSASDLPSPRQGDRSNSTATAVEPAKLSPEVPSSVNRPETATPEPLERFQLEEAQRSSAPVNSSTAVTELPQEADQTEMLASLPGSLGILTSGVRSLLPATVFPSLPPLSEADTYLPKDGTTFNGYAWPAQGVLTSGYGWRWGRMHRGIDIAAPVGTPIVASAPGVVTSSGWNAGGYGNLVEIQHPDGSLTLYAHNNRLLVRKGQHVIQGQQIAEMGSTGYSTGPHLHFELHPRGKGAVNPIAFLSQTSG